MEKKVTQAAKKPVNSGINNGAGVGGGGRRKQRKNGRILETLTCMEMG